MKTGTLNIAFRARLHQLINEAGRTRKDFMKAFGYGETTLKKIGQGEMSEVVEGVVRDIVTRWFGDRSGEKFRWLFDGWQRKERPPRQPGPDRAATRLDEHPNHVAPAPDSQERAARLIMEFRRAYADGQILESLTHITKAYELTPNDTTVVSRYAVALMRVGRENAVRELLERAKQSGMYDDAVKGVEGEYLRRQGKPEMALSILETVQNPEYYNITYEKGMCNLLLYSQRRRTSDLLQAVAHLTDARRSHPRHWWVMTNLAIASRVIGERDDDLDQSAIKQLEDAIQRHPLKASARIYRLLYYVMLQDGDRLISTIAADHESCPKAMEVACDFFNTVQERVALICPDKERAGQFMELLRRWALRFTLLHT